MDNVQLVERLSFIITDLNSAVKTFISTKSEPRKPLIMKTEFVKDRYGSAISATTRISEEK